MKHSWVPYAAVAAGAVLLLKAVLIFGAQGDDFGAVTGVLYLAGLLLALAAAIGFGLQQRRGRRTLVAVAGVVALVAWVIGVGDLTAPAFESVFGDEAYVGDEGPIGLLGVVLLALGARGRLGSREPAVA
jgi:drug/metabolite transporter (DMT)-like permease